MVAAAERHGVPLFVGHTVRFDPAYRAVQAAVAEGLLGRLLSLSARRSMGADEGRIYAGRTDPALCLGVHDIDAMRWCAGEVTRVAAETGPALLHPDSPDVVVATLRFASGAVGVLEMCWALPAATGVEWESALVIVGSEDSRYLEQRGGSGGDSGARAQLRIRGGRADGRCHAHAGRALPAGRARPRPLARRDARRCAPRGRDRTRHRPGGRNGFRRRARPSRVTAFTLSGRVALISGGGTGIGRAIALELARAGAAVAVCGRRSEPLAATIADVRERRRRRPRVRG